VGRYRGSDSPVFPGFSQSNYRNRWWVPLLRRAGVEYRTPYQLRHTFATLLLNATQELAGVSAALGHADTEITARVYAEARRSATDYAATVRRVVEEDR
jgi:integrase